MTTAQQNQVKNHATPDTEREKFEAFIEQIKKDNHMGEGMEAEALFAAHHSWMQTHKEAVKPGRANSSPQPGK